MGVVERACAVVARVVERPSVRQPRLAAPVGGGAEMTTLAPARVVCARRTSPGFARPAPSSYPVRDYERTSARSRGRRGRTRSRAPSPSARRPSRPNAPTRSRRGSSRASPAPAPRREGRARLLARSDPRCYACSPEHTRAPPSTTAPARASPRAPPPRPGCSSWSFPLCGAASLARRRGSGTCSAGESIPAGTCRSRSMSSG